MSKRAPVKVSKDKKVFRNTANKTKSINLGKTIMRGGTRL